ncbi:MAG: hypothetical protein ACRCYY_10870 [Trueperaceae bacterium]
MDEIVKVVAQKTGVPDETTRQVIVAVFQHFKEKLPRAIVGPLEAILGTNTPATTSKPEETETNPTTPTVKTIPTVKTTPSTETNPTAKTSPASETMPTNKPPAVNKLPKVNPNQTRPTPAATDAANKTTGVTSNKAS